tara:strand:+ start:2864 stop:3325 length:462 start_codon:yes stop_codon:yes gene_type:complete
VLTYNNIKMKKAKNKQVLKLKKKPSKKITKVEKKVAPIVVKEFLSSRYSFNIISLSADEKNRIKEIKYSYTGVLLIPKSLKKLHSPKSVAVEGSYIINSNDSLSLRDYKTLTKKEVIVYLQKMLRDDYIQGMKDIILQELLPEIKKIEKLPWI